VRVDSHGAGMADKVPTAANVRTSVVPKRANAGVAIAAGDILAKDAGGLIQLFDANSGTAELRTYEGTAVNSAAAGQPVLYTNLDPTFTPGFAIAAGELVIGSATPGKCCPDTDAVSGWFVTVLGIGVGNNQMNLSPLAAGLAVP
jgi:hypothetical protein